MAPTALLTPLRNRTYLHLFSPQVVALVGTGLLTVALCLLAFDIAGGSAGCILAYALTIKILIYVLLSPVVTALAANWNPGRCWSAPTSSAVPSR